MLNKEIWNMPWIIKKENSTSSLEKENTNFIKQENTPIIRLVKM